MITKRVFLILFCLFGFAMGCGQVEGESLISKDEALLVAQKTEEVKHFYRLRDRDGQLLKDECLEKRVLKTCDSDWVSCIEDAWVVEFNVLQSCISHDGRLTVKLLINAKDSEVISRFPEAAYFRDSQYCLEDYDCLSVADAQQNVMCLNFISGQLNGGIISENNCICRISSCIQRFDRP